MPDDAYRRRASREHLRCDLSNAGWCSRRRRSAAGCSRISSRNREPGSTTGSPRVPQPTTRARPPTSTLLDLELVRQDDDVGGQPDPEPPTVGRRRTRAGTSVAVPTASSSGTPSAWRFLIASIIVSVLPASAPSAPRATPSLMVTSTPPRRYSPSLSPAPAIASVTSATRPGRGFPHHRGSRRRDVHLVEDELDDHVVACQGGSGDAGVSMVERPHGVEEVRDAPHAEVEGGVGLLGARIGVAARDGDLASQKPLDDLARSRELGRERHQSDGPRIEEPFEQAQIGVAASRGRMDPESEGGDERPFEVDPQYAWPVRLGRHLAEGGEELLFGSGDEGREEGGDARLQQGVSGTSIAVGVCREEVDAEEAVDLEVDEVRGRRSRDRSGRRARSPAMRPSATSTSPGMSRPSTSAASTPRRTSALHRSVDAPSRSVEPGARRVRVDPGEKRDDRHARVALGGGRTRRRHPRGGAPVAALTIRRTRASSFSFAGTTSTMRFPYVLPSRIIEIVEIVLSTSFCAVPAFSRVEPARNSGPTTTAISCSTSRPSSESGTATMHAVTAPACAAASSAPSTYGVRPLALTPTTASRCPTPSARVSSAPDRRSSSATPSSSGDASSPPATSATTLPGSVANVDSHSAASSAAINPDEPAPT